MEVLIVAEKPDVAREIASYLSGKQGVNVIKSSNHLSVGDTAITWARGHLMELASVDDYYPDIARTQANSKNGVLYWNHVPLPILPQSYLYKPAQDDGKIGQLKKVGELMKAAKQIYNAADRDREGQLIFDEIIEHFKIKGKPVKRLIFSSLNESALDQAFKNIADNDLPVYRNAGLAAKLRSQSDWLIGMNGTRALTLAHAEKGVANVGRVMTPTMSVVVRRHLEIQSFKSIPFYVPMIKMPDGTVLEWRKRVTDDLFGIDSEGRIIDKGVAQKIVDAINANNAGEITEAKSVERREEPPLPYSLPVIQSELSKRYGLSVDEITKACQSLYEKKMQSYLGTDCRYLPEAMHTEAAQVLAGLRGVMSKNVDGANTKIKYGCWNDKKLTGDDGAAHHGIIPTGVVKSCDSEAERLVYQAVCSRYVAQFYPEHRYNSITLKAQFGQDEFGATANVVVANGWKDVDQDFSKESLSDHLGEDDADRHTSSAKQTNQRA